MNKEKVIEVLKTINDPELMVDIYTLGLIYDISLENNNVKVLMTLTTPMCPFGPQLIAEVNDKLKALEGINEVNVELTFEPLWQPSQELKASLGFE